MKTKFWDFPSSSKIDVLDEKHHAPLIAGALMDAETQIDTIEDGFILYGEEEALLFRPRTLVMWFPVELLRIFLGIAYRKN